MEYSLFALIFVMTILDVMVFSYRRLSSGIPAVGTCSWAIYAAWRRVGCRRKAP